MKKYPTFLVAGLISLHTSTHASQIDEQLEDSPSTAIGQYELVYGAPKTLITTHYVPKSMLQELVDKTYPLTSQQKGSLKIHFRIHQINNFFKEKAESDFWVKVVGYHVVQKEQITQVKQPILVNQGGNLVAHYKMETKKENVDALGQAISVIVFKNASFWNTVDFQFVAHDHFFNKSEKSNLCSSILGKISKGLLKNSDNRILFLRYSEDVKTPFVFSVQNNDGKNLTPQPVQDGLESINLIQMASEISKTKKLEKSAKKYRQGSERYSQSYPLVDISSYLNENAFR